MDAPLQGDTGGHTGTAPTKLRYTSAYNPPKRYQLHKRDAYTIHTHIGGGNASRTPAPILKIKKCVYRYDFGATVDEAICFETSYDFGVAVDDAIRLKTSYDFGVTVASP